MRKSFVGLCLVGCVLAVPVRAETYEETKAKLDAGKVEAMACLTEQATALAASKETAEAMAELAVHRCTTPEYYRATALRNIDARMTAMDTIVRVRMAK